MIAVSGSTCRPVLAWHTGVFRFSIFPQPVISHAFRMRTPCDRVQWRDLQLGRVARRPGGCRQGSCLERTFRYRSPASSHCGVGFAWRPEARARMFALALWDRVERCLLLARDRMGEKPLYYGIAAGSFVFASELRHCGATALAGCGRSRGARPIHASWLCFRRRSPFIAAYTSCRQGTWLRVEADGRFAAPQPWWSFAQLAENASNEPLRLSDSAAIDALEDVLRGAVREQMVADVPLGALLSGGLDSSLVVALMQAQSRQPVRTFTIGFAESDYDEAQHAKAVARHLGTSIPSSMSARRRLWP